jgi:hypothetical protein
MPAFNGRIDTSWELMNSILTHVCSDVKGFVSDNNEKPIVKTPYNIYGKMIVVIHESLVGRAWD